MIALKIFGGMPWPMSYTTSDGEVQAVFRDLGRQVLWNIYFWVSDVETLYHEFIGRGGKIDYGLCDQPYGCREFGNSGFGRTRYWIWSGDRPTRLKPGTERMQPAP